MITGCDLFNSAELGCVGSLHIWSPEPDNNDPRAEILRQSSQLRPRLHLDRPPAHHHSYHHLFPVPFPCHAGGVLEEHIQGGGGWGFPHPKTFQ